MAHNILSPDFIDNATVDDVINECQRMIRDKTQPLMLVSMLPILLHKKQEEDSKRHDELLQQVNDTLNVINARLDTLESRVTEIENKK